MGRRRDSFFGNPLGRVNVQIIAKISFKDLYSSSKDNSGQKRWYTWFFSPREPMETAFVLSVQVCLLCDTQTHNSYTTATGQHGVRNTCYEKSRAGVSFLSLQASPPPISQFYPFGRRDKRDSIFSNLSVFSCIGLHRNLPWNAFHIYPSDLAPEMVFLNQFNVNVIRRSKCTAAFKRIHLLTPFKILEPDCHEHGSINFYTLLCIYILLTRTWLEVHQERFWVISQDFWRYLLQTTWT